MDKLKSIPFCRKISFEKYPSDFNIKKNQTQVVTFTSLCVKKGGVTRINNPFL